MKGKIKACTTMTSQAPGQHCNPQRPVGGQTNPRNPYPPKRGKTVARMRRVAVGGLSAGCTYITKLRGTEASAACVPRRECLG